ncbi:MAG: methyl-accepting chemotaxis protein [Pseudomonadota bacterium]
MFGQKKSDDIALSLPSEEVADSHGAEMANAADRGDQDANFSMVAKGLSAFGLEMVDVRGAIDGAHGAMDGLRQAFAELGATAHETRSRTGSIRDSVTSTTMVADASAEAMNESKAALGKVSSDISDLILAVGNINSQLQGLQSALGSVSDVSKSIDQIARQTNLLALNATIEAARAGEAGKGFAVVAGEVKLLASQTSNATQQIQTTLDELSSEANALISLGEGALDSVEAVKDSTGSLNTVVDELATSIAEIASAGSAVEEGIASIEETNANLLGQVSGIQASIEENNQVLAGAVERIGDAVDETDRLVGVTADSGLNTDDGRFLEIAKNAASEIQQKVDQQLSNGSVSIEDLFDCEYKAIEGSNPVQFLTKATKFTDAHFSMIQENTAKSDERIVFCAAVDVNGYLPTHNSRFSKPQGSDVVWNNANCRNRRIFDDRVGLRAGKNQKPFLFQSYRRDMGGGNFAIMKDLSVPLHFGGRHWGGLRLAFKV